MGQTLNTYLQEHVFRPLGIQDMAMIPSHNMRMRLAYMNHRSADGTLSARNHPLRAPLTLDPDNKDEVTRVFNSGGAGMFAKPQDYCSEY